MRAIVESTTYTTVENPDEALAASFDLFKGDVDQPWSATRRADNYFPQVVFVVKNVDVGATITLQVGADTPEGDKAVQDDFWRYQIKALTAVNGTTTLTVADGVTSAFNIETDTSDGAEEHLFAIAPRLNVFVSATCDAGGTVEITCYMTG